MPFDGSRLLAEYERWRPELAGLLDTRFHTIEWLDSAVLGGELHLFSDEKSAIVVSVQVYPTGAKEAHIECAAGELAHLVGPAIRRVEEWSVNQGCIVLTISSRAGWQKIMANQGYEKFQTSIRKDLV